MCCPWTDNAASLPLIGTHLGCFYNYRNKQTCTACPRALIVQYNSLWPRLEICDISSLPPASPSTSSQSDLLILCNYTEHLFPGFYSNSPMINNLVCINLCQFFFLKTISESEITGSKGTDYFKALDTYYIKLFSGKDVPTDNPDSNIMKLRAHLFFNLPLWAAKNKVLLFTF